MITAFNWCDENYDCIESKRAGRPGFKILNHVKISYDNLYEIKKCLEKYLEEGYLKKEFEGMEIYSKKAGFCYQCVKQEDNMNTLVLKNDIESSREDCRKRLCRDCCEYILEEINKILDEILYSSEFVFIKELGEFDNLPVITSDSMNSIFIQIGETASVRNDKLYSSVREFDEIMNSLTKSTKNFTGDDKQCKICHGYIFEDEKSVYFNNSPFKKSHLKQRIYSHQKCLDKVVGSLREFSDEYSHIISSKLL